MSDESSACEFELESDSDDVDDEQIEVENLIYTSMQDVETDPAKALDGFSRAVELERTKGEWGFKALCEIVKLHIKSQRFTEMMGPYRRLLTYIQSAVTRNMSEASINGILDAVSSAPTLDVEGLRQFYGVTLAELEAANNERLWFKTKLRLGKMLFERKEFGEAARVIRELEASCKAADGTFVEERSSELLETYALEIQLYTEMRDNKRLRALYHRSLAVTSSLPHPRIIGIIRECGGKMHMSEREWRSAYQDFFEAFRRYDESGDARKIQCLKYLVLANMLSESGINPFDSNEAKAYKDDPQIVAMTSLIDAYHRDDLQAFDRTLRLNRVGFTDDPFIREYVVDLLRTVRCNYLLQLVAPYKALRLTFVADALGVQVAEAETLLLGLIMDGRITARVDQAAGVCELGGHSQSAALTVAAATHDMSERLRSTAAALEQFVATIAPPP